MPSHSVLPVQNIDRNLEVIRQIESAGTLPEALPDEVKLDLAVTGGSPEAITRFLQGLGDDLKEATRRVPVPARPQFRIARTDITPVDLGQFVGGILGLDPARQLAADAVVQWKRRAADEGYLDLSPDEVSSPVWLPEYNVAARQMFLDDMEARFQGEKPGSLSINQVADLVQQWLSPAGLAKAATEYDDVGFAEADPPIRGVR